MCHSWCARQILRAHLAVSLETWFSLSGIHLIPQRESLERDHPTPRGPGFEATLQSCCVPWRIDLSSSPCSQPPYSRRPDKITSLSEGAGASTLRPNRSPERGTAAQGRPTRPLLGPQARRDGRGASRGDPSCRARGTRCWAGGRGGRLRSGRRRGSWVLPWRRLPNFDHGVGKASLAGRGTAGRRRRMRQRTVLLRSVFFGLYPFIFIVLRRSPRLMTALLKMKR